MQKNNVPYNEAQNLIKDSDVLLIRGTAWYSWFIKRWTQSQYSHSGLASWSDDILEILEFNECKGGGVGSNLANWFPKYSGHMDVYRPDTAYEERIFDPETKLVNDRWVKLNAKEITQTMRNITGRKYSMDKIIMFAKRLLLFTRFFENPDDLTKLDNGTIIHPVCSTAIAYAFAKNNFILLRNRSYEWITPGDLALSPVLNYLFTIV